MFLLPRFRIIIGNKLNQSLKEGRMTKLFIFATVFGEDL